MNSEPMVWPVKRLDVSPPSDGAAAVILRSEEFAKKLTKEPVRVAGCGWNIDSTYWTDRDLYYPQYLENAGNMAYKQARIKNPRAEIDFAEVYDPFDYKELHHMEGSATCEKGRGAETDCARDYPKKWRASDQSVRWTPRRGKPHRRGRNDESLRNILPV